jgi:hypothetical protein
MAFTEYERKAALYYTVRVSQKFLLCYKPPHRWMSMFLMFTGLLMCAVVDGGRHIRAKETSAGKEDGSTQAFGSQRLETG